MNFLPYKYSYQKKFREELILQPGDNVLVQSQFFIHSRKATIVNKVNDKNFDVKYNNGRTEQNVNISRISEEIDSYIINIEPFKNSDHCNLTNDTQTFTIFNVNYILDDEVFLLLCAEFYLVYFHDLKTYFVVQNGSVNKTIIFSEKDALNKEVSTHSRDVSSDKEFSNFLSSYFNAEITYSEEFRNLLNKINL